MSKPEPPSPWRRVLAINAGLTVALCGLVLLGYWAFGSDRRFAPTPVSVEGGVSMWHEDPRYGFRHVPSVKGNHITYSFNASYTIDAKGYRYTLDPVNQRGKAYVLGCSWSFGDGVSDNEAYPYLLGRDYWPDVKVVNAACMAWGTTQALMAVEDALAEDPLPKLIIYGWIDGHLMRNYLSHDWVDMMANFDRKVPWFEIENDAPVFKGIVGAEAGQDRNPALTEKEMEITYHLLVEMNRRCLEKEVPFFVVSLPVGFPNDSNAEKTLKRAQGAGVKWLDLNGICDKDDFLKNDGHPAPAAHRKIARALAEHPDIARVMNH